jgi:hypothetical protein
LREFFAKHGGGPLQETERQVELYRAAQANLEDGVVLTTEQEREGGTRRGWSRISVEFEDRWGIWMGTVGGILHHPGWKRSPLLYVCWRGVIASPSERCPFFRLIPTAPIMEVTEVSSVFQPLLSLPRDNADNAATIVLPFARNQHESWKDDEWCDCTAQSHWPSLFTSKVRETEKKKTERERERERERKKKIERCAFRDVRCQRASRSPASPNGA